jgi:hypothetical protein
MIDALVAIHVMQGEFKPHPLGGSPSDQKSTEPTGACLIWNFQFQNALLRAHIKRRQGDNGRQISTLYLPCGVPAYPGLRARPETDRREP